MQSLRQVRKTYRRSIITSAEIARLERRMQWACGLLIAFGLIAMWAYVGYQLNLLEGMK